MFVVVVGLRRPDCSALPRSDILVSSARDAYFFVGPLGGPGGRPFQEKNTCFRGVSSGFYSNYDSFSSSAGAQIAVAEGVLACRRAGVLPGGHPCPNYSAT